MATVRMPSSLAARITRMAISLRFATRRLRIFFISVGRGASSGRQRERSGNESISLLEQVSCTCNNRSIYHFPVELERARVSFRVFDNTLRPRKLGVGWPVSLVYLSDLGWMDAKLPAEAKATSALAGTTELVSIRNGDSNSINWGCNPSSSRG
ncbi:conserved hypothetical protein [Cupriavidus taiwanensis]|nr:conserved hypothetical protein [Cupriavidus taiwanensis]